MISLANFTHTSTNNTPIYTEDLHKNGAHSYKTAYDANGAFEGGSFGNGTFEGTNFANGAFEGSNFGSGAFGGPNFPNASFEGVNFPNNSFELSENFTEYAEIPYYIKATSMTFCIVIMCLGVIGNVMVPIVILKTKDMRNSTNIFLVNLSIADLMVLLVCTPTVLVEVNSKPETWVLGKELCLAVPFVELTVAHASVLTILAISFERYYAICEPLRAGYVCTKTRATLICALAWFFAALFTSPILAVATYTYDELEDGTQVPVCLTQADTFWSALFFILTIAVFFIIPLAVLLVLYSVIAKNLMENPVIISQNTKNTSNAGNVVRYRKQVILMLGTVVLSFFVCLLPFKALTLWIIVFPPETIMSLGVDGYYILLYFCRVMLYLNSAINPILYNLMSSKFREGFVKLLRINKLIKCGRSFRENMQRRDTFNTTTSTGFSSSQNTDSFWKRYSNKARKDDKENDDSKKKRKSIDRSTSQKSNSSKKLKEVEPQAKVVENIEYPVEAGAGSEVIQIGKKSKESDKSQERVVANIDCPTQSVADSEENGKTDFPRRNSMKIIAEINERKGINDVVNIEASRINSLKIKAAMNDDMYVEVYNKDTAAKNNKPVQILNLDVKTNNVYSITLVNEEGTDKFV